MYKQLYIYFICFLFSNNCRSQVCDFQTQKYQVTIDSNIVYGTDTLYNLQTTDLKMHIYSPVGDQNTNRPVVIWLYGGAWVAGAKEDMANWCMRFAKRGYVAVTIQYRLGFFNDVLVPYIGNIPRPYGPEEPMRAAYRAQQDLKGAIRFIKGKKDIYKIDTSMIFIGGQSAGAITSLSAAFMNEQSQKPKECKSISNYTNALQGYNIKRPDLGPVEGQLNMNGCGTKVKGVINMFGAIFDTSWIKTANDIAVFSYHQSIDYNTEDIVVSSYTKTFFWSLSLNYPWASGSRIIQQRLNSLGYDSCHAFTYIYPGITHGLHDEASVDIGIALLMNNLVCTNPCYPLGILKNEIKSYIHIFPNPVENDLYIQSNINNIQNIYIYDLTGKCMSNYSYSCCSNYNINISTHGLAKGIYIVKIIGIDMEEVRKIIKN
jgi:dienelactone hydrolase